MTLTETKQENVLCPVCGGPVAVFNKDKVNRCEYCAAPVLGSSQSRDCVNHPGTLAKEVCHVCGDLICEECEQKRVGEYGGKLLTIVNCDKPACIAESEWAKPLNEDYLKLANMDWADKVDNLILRITGFGAIIMMVFELIFFLGMLYFQYMTPWSIPSITFFDLPEWFTIPLTLLLLSILGNLLSAILLQSALQVYIHERQLGAGVTLLVILVIEVIHLLFRGLLFGLRGLPNPVFLPMLLGAFLFGTILVFIGSLMAIYVGNKKRNQLRIAREKLQLSLKQQLENFRSSS